MRTGRCRLINLLIQSQAGGVHPEQPAHSISRATLGLSMAPSLSHKTPSFIPAGLRPEPDAKELGQGGDGGA
ncbi:hypothetical protein DUNSADRAFT_11473, partial [Dunaliella salina]